MSSYQRGPVSCITLDHNMSTRCLGRHHLLTCRHAQAAIASSSRHSAPGKLISRPGHWTHGCCLLAPGSCYHHLYSVTSNTSTPSHVSLTSQIFLLTPDIFTAFTAFYDVARGSSSSRCLLLLEGWHALLMALLVLNSWPLTIIARYQLSHCITFGHYCSNKAERLRDRRIHLDAR